MQYGEMQREYNESLEEEFKRVAWGTVREMLPQIAEKYEEIFHRAVQEFYWDYDPQIYGRHYSLFDAVEFDYDPNSMKISYTAMPENTTPFRSGNGNVFNLAFERGYHGGADHGDYSSYPVSDPDDSGFTISHRPHPNPGTPYWRTPHPWYTHWGQPAARSTPPADVFMEKKEEYLSGEMLMEFKNLLFNNLGI